VNYLPFAVNWEGVKRDKWGVTSLFLNQNFNFQALSASSSARFAKIAQTSTQNASGTFYILSPGVTREQNIYQDWGVTLRANGQWASESLIGNEQFAMGGLAGPRGYRDGEQYGDAGWRVSIEPHTPLFHVAMINSTVPWRMRFSIFTDYGQRYDYTTKFTEPDGTAIPIPERVGQLNLWGAGFGLSGTIGKNLDYRFATAVPFLATALSPEWHPRIYFAIAAQF
jgi:hemolysin activation/secretion protein